MQFNRRSYQANSDLYATGDLIRSAYRKNPSWNGWSFPRFDIWAQRRIAEELVHLQVEWQQNISLWWDDAGKLRGTAAFDRRALGMLVSDPDCPEVLEPMLDWLVLRYGEIGKPGRPLQIETLERNLRLSGLLTGRGFTRQADWMNVRRKSLDPAQPEPVILPPGFRLRHAATCEDLLGHVTAVGKVFNMLDPLEVYQIVTLAPSYRPEFNLLVMNPASEAVAFATLWVDPSLSQAEFEPVGTLPDYQKLGLGLAVLAEGCNRLRALGCATVGVDSWSESPGANRLYEKAGFQTLDRLLGWEHL